MHILTLMRQGNSLTLAVPRRVLTALKLNKGDRVICDVQDDAIVYRRMEPFKAAALKRASAAAPPAAPEGGAS